MVLNTETEPTEKKFLIEFNNSISLTCKVIIKHGSIVQPIAAVRDLNIDIAKQPSASANPVTHQGFKRQVSTDLVVLHLDCDLINRLLLRDAALGKEKGKI